MKFYHPQMVIEMTEAKRPPTMHENMTEELAEKIKVKYPIQGICFKICVAPNFNEIQ